MYETTIKVRKILDGKPVFIMLAVLGIWLALTAECFIVGIMVTTYALCGRIY